MNRAFGNPFIGMYFMLNLLHCQSSVQILITQILLTMPMFLKRGQHQVNIEFYITLSDSLQKSMQGTRDTVFFIQLILLPCHNPVPTLPTMQLHFYQPFWEIQVCYACKVAIIASSCKPREIGQARFFLTPRPHIFFIFKLTLTHRDITT